MDVAEVHEKLLEESDQTKKDLTAQEKRSRCFGRIAGYLSFHRAERLSELMKTDKSTLETCINQLLALTKVFYPISKSHLQGCRQSQRTRLRSHLPYDRLFIHRSNQICHSFIIQNDFAHARSYRRKSRSCPSTCQFHQQTAF